MGNISVRDSVLGLKIETTEGTLIAPDSTSSYLALQDDASITENRETLENMELTGNIGVAKPIVGISSPELSLSAYIRASGTEGVAPDNGILLKSLFGTETVRGTERNTVSGSTSTVINVDSGEGAEFARGHSILNKHADGYELRPIESVATDALTLGFALTNTPGTGVDLGKNVAYIPADGSHPTVSAHLYNGDGGIHQAIAGGRVLSCAITANAGQLINGSFNLTGTSYYVNPITIAAADISIDFTETGPTTHEVSIAAKSYNDPEQLASAIATAMNAAASDTITCVYNSTGASAGKFTIASDGSLLSLLWASGNNTLTTIGDQIGFTVGADDTGAITYTSDTAVSWASPHTGTIVYDGADPVSAKDHEILFGDSATDITSLQASTLSIDISNDKANINDISAASGIRSSLITGRSSTISFTAVLPQHDVENFARYRRGDACRFCYNSGTKSDGTNWDAGSTTTIYSPTCVISSLEIVNEDSIARLSAELQPYVSGGLGEIYISHN